MNSKRSAVAALALAIGATALASSEAWARDPDKEIPVEPAVVLHDPGPGHDPTPANTSATEDHSRIAAVQAGASALGGAGVACGAMWLYRRRSQLTS
jgi:hypothetical protein